MLFWHQLLWCKINRKVQVVMQSWTPVSQLPPSFPQFTLDGTNTHHYTCRFFLSKSSLLTQSWISLYTCLHFLLSHHSHGSLLVVFHFWWDLDSFINMFQELNMTQYVKFVKIHTISHSLKPLFAGISLPIIGKIMRSGVARKKYCHCKTYHLFFWDRILHYPF